MKLPISIAANLVRLQRGEKIPFSKMKHESIEIMLENGILIKQTIGRSKAIINLPDSEKLNVYLQNHYGIENLKYYVEGLYKINLTRSEAVDISSNSKLKYVRTFKGFLLNSLEPIECKLNDIQFAIYPAEGTFTFVYDFESFIPAENVTIVGIENPSNFRFIQKQQKLFKELKPLFVSRYPQSKDLIRWLQTIPNHYIHFGDFDFAGLNIYINEFKKHLQEKATFFLPPDVSELLERKGNRDNYSNQKVQFDRREIKEENVLTLLSIIDKYKKGLEQEIFIENLIIDS